MKKLQLLLMTFTFAVLFADSPTKETLNEAFAGHYAAAKNANGPDCYVNLKRAVSLAIYAAQVGHGHVPEDQLDWCHKQQKELLILSRIHTQRQMAT